MSRPIRAAGTRPNFDSTENRPPLRDRHERRAEIHCAAPISSNGVPRIGNGNEVLCSGSVRCGIAQHTKKVVLKDIWLECGARFGTDQEICLPGDSARSTGADLVGIR